MDGALIKKLDRVHNYLLAVSGIVCFSLPASQKSPLNASWFPQDLLILLQIKEIKNIYHLDPEVNQMVISRQKRYFGLPDI